MKAKDRSSSAPKAPKGKGNRKSSSSPQEAGNAAPSQKGVRVVIADDHVLLRELIVALLSSGPLRLEVLAETDSGDDAVLVCQELRPDVLLIDLRLVVQAGSAMIVQLRRRAPSVRVLIYSGSASDAEIVKVMQQGVDGVIGRAQTGEEFLRAMDLISRGDNYFCAHSSRLLAEIASGKHSETKRESQLSPRETEIVRFIAQGHTSKEIAAALKLSVATIDTHRRNSMAKVGARNAADLIRYGHEHGLLDFESES